MVAGPTTRPWLAWPEAMSQLHLHPTQIKPEAGAETHSSQSLWPGDGGRGEGSGEFDEQHGSCSFSIPYPLLLAPPPVLGSY